MTAMRERLIASAAKDICRRAHVRQYGEADWRPGELDIKVEQYWRHYVPDAESVIDSILSGLRLPDEAMLSAADEADSTPEDWPNTPAPEPTHGEVFTAMIDAVREGK